MAEPNLTFSCDPDNTAEQPYVPPELCIGTLTTSTGDCAENDAKFMEETEAEAINIAGGPINIFKLLGVHDQGSTINQVGDGYPISSGTPSGYNAANAFNISDDSWASVQLGMDVITTPAYIGYNFGTKKTPGTNVDRYAPPAPIKKYVQTVKIKQGDQQNNRATQVRVEASNDGITWIRIDVINLLNTGNLETYKIKKSAEYSQWRFVPTMFKGILSNSAWEVVEIQLMDNNQLSLDYIQDLLLMENRDRAYSQTSTCMKATYDLMDIQTELSRFGLDIPTQYMFTVSFAVMVQLLGRPVVVGDIIEIPGEAEYDANLRPVRKWTQVVSAGWSSDGVTPNWKHTLFRFFAEPILPSQETRDVTGTPKNRFAQTDDEFLAGNFPLNVQAFEATEAIVQEASELVPETGSDGLLLTSAENNYHIPGTTDQRELYVEDGLPPNGLPYTEGLEMPDIIADGIQDGDYFRLIYAAHLKIPARLFQWSAVKNRWIFKEQDKRRTYESYRPTLSNLLKSATKKNINDKDL